jgi:DNA-binding Lrp family transcriptional regulator
LNRKEPDNYKSSGKNRELMGHLKSVDAHIIEELLDDAYTSSTDISKKYKSPLSTVQRRRRALEKTILLRRYEIDLTKHGFRIAEITVVPKSGMSEEIANRIFSEYRKNILSISVKIDGSVMLTLYAYFKETDEIYNIMERLNSMPSVKAVKFAEIVQMIRRKTNSIGSRVVNSSDSKVTNPKRLNFSSHKR